MTTSGDLGKSIGPVDDYTVPRVLNSGEEWQLPNTRRRAMWLAIAMLGLLPVVTASADEGDEIVIALTEQNDSGVTGTVSLSDQGNQTRVLLELDNGSDEDHPAHIHIGSCDNLTPQPLYPLETVIDGVSESTIDVSLEDLLAEPHAINVHASEEETDLYIACGEITGVLTVATPTPIAGTVAPSQTATPTAETAITVNLDEQDNSGVSGVATFAGTGSQTVVRLDLDGAPSGVEQPTHIHSGTCATLDPTPLYPLNNAVNGQSETTLDVPLQQLLTEPHAINVHRSAESPQDYVACGEIIAGAGGGAPSGQLPPNTGGADSANSLLMLIVATGLVAIGAGVFLRRRAV